MTIPRTTKKYFFKEECENPECCGILDENRLCENCDFCQKCDRELNHKFRYVPLCDICDIDKYCNNCGQYLWGYDTCLLCDYCPKHGMLLIMDDCCLCTPKDFCRKCKQPIGSYFDREKFCKRCYRKKKCMFCKKKKITEEGKCGSKKCKRDRTFFEKLMRNDSKTQIQAM